MAKIKKYRLRIILLFFLCLSILWVFRIPVPTQPPDSRSHFNPDEWSHIAYIDYIASNKSFPSFTPKYSVPLFQQPYYYLTMAPIYLFIKSYLGYEYAVYFIRMISSLLGTGIVYLTYKSIRLIMKDDLKGIIGATVVAMIPAFVSLSAAVTNEIFASFFSTLTLYMFLKLIIIRKKLKFSSIILVSLLTAVSIGAKLTTCGLLPILLLIIHKRSYLNKISSRLLMIFCSVAINAVLVGWWFIFSRIKYGDYFKLKASQELWNQIISGYSTLTERYHISVFHYFFIVSKYSWFSFWGMFNALHQPLPNYIYLFLLVIFMLALAGFIMKIVKKLSYTEIITVMYLISVVIIFILFNYIRYAPQGRYLYPALLPIGFIIVTGWSTFKPKWVNLIYYTYISFMVIVNIFSVIYFPGHINPVYMNPIFLH